MGDTYFRMHVLGMLDAAAVPANQPTVNRVYAMAGLNFDNMYDNNQDFRNFIRGFLIYVEENGLRFANLVTPENSPQNSPGRRGGDGDGGGAAGGGAPMAA